MKRRRTDFDYDGKTTNTIGLTQSCRSLDQMFNILLERSDMVGLDVDEANAVVVIQTKTPITRDALIQYVESKCVRILF